MVLAYGGSWQNALDAEGGGGERETEREVGGQAVLGRQEIYSTPWLTKRHGYDPTYRLIWTLVL